MKIGVKIYSYDWYNIHKIEPQQLAELLQKWGISYVMVMNDHLDDMSRSNRTLKSLSLDNKFREACQKAKIDYWMTIRSFYNPKALKMNPEWNVMNQHAEWIKKKDWYCGINPSDNSYINWLLEKIEIAQKDLKPDGAFLSFTRWPGFWETRFKDAKFETFEDTSYDLATLQRFGKSIGVEISQVMLRNPYLWLKEYAWESWVSWKCEVIKNYCTRVKNQMIFENSNIQLMLNTLPFCNHEFLSPRRETFGQDIKMLSEIINIFEVMTYHQIMKEDVDWIVKAGLDVRNQTDKPVICTLQSSPYYTDGFHEEANREKFVNQNDMIKAKEKLAQNNFYGVAFFPLKDLLLNYYTTGEKPFWF